MSVFQRLFAFFDSVWSFILTLVRSLLALFSFHRRASSDPLSLPSINRTHKDALARAHSRLRPIFLTPRSLTLDYAQRAQSTRSRSATSTLVAPASVPQASGPQRTSPKLDPHDPELGLSVTVPAASATSSHEGTPDTSTSLRTSVYVSPLTPPDRCYLAPLPSATDCPYTEPWPANATLDRGKPKLPASPLKVSINVDPKPIGSPSPERWSPVQIWSSTPYKNDSSVPDPALSPFELQGIPSPALANISNALISRSQGSIRPYDDVSNTSASSDASPFVDYANGPFARSLRRPDPTQRPRTHARVLRSRNQPYPQFHHPDAYTYAYAWRRHGARLPGKPDRTRASRSQSHADLQANEWYDADAYALSPVSALSPPRCESATEDEDEDEVPLGRLRERLARRSVAAGASIGFGMPVGAKAAVMSPRTRRMSDGCLLAISESTPTRVGVGARSGRHALSLALDGDGYNPKDWLEALSLQYSSEQRGAPEPELQPCMAVPSVDALVVN